MGVKRSDYVDEYFLLFQMLLVLVVRVVEFGDF